MNYAYSGTRILMISQQARKTITATIEYLKELATKYSANKMEQDKKETALRTLSKSLRKRFQGPTVKISWIELDAFMMKAQTIEMTHILNAYNDGYADCKAGKPNRSQDESNTDL